MDDKEKNREQLLQELGELTGAIQDAKTPEAVWQTLTHALQTVLSCSRTAVYIKNQSTAAVSCPYVNSITRRLRHTFQEKISQYFTQEFKQHGQPIAVNDLTNSPDSESIKTALIEEGIGAYVLFFLSISDDLWGVIAAFRDVDHPYTSVDLSIGQTLIHVGTANIRNLYLLQEANEVLLQEQKRNEMTRTLSSALDLPHILQSVSRMATELISADAGLLGLVIDNQIMIFYPHNIPPKINLRPAARGRGVAWEIVETSQSIMINDYMAHPLAQQKWGEIGIKAFLGVPVLCNDECLGALTVFNMYSDDRFTRRELALVESVGQQAGIAIQNARMFAEAGQRAAALANALNRQEELDKLKNQFIQTVSHELRSPLGIIYGHAELLESGDFGRLTEMQQNSIQIISGRVRMLTDLVDDLTALMAAETQEFRRDFINPLQLLYSMFAEYRMQAKERRIELQSDITEDLPWVHGDLTHLRRVFDNLFSNAFKFTPAGGRVTIRMFAQGEQVVIEVADTGEGIAAEHLSRIFERFYQVTDEQNRPRRKGTGLGLSLVKEIIEAHRGQVFVESEPGVGTTFRIELPGHAPP